MKKFLADADSGVRHWGAMGALMRGAPAVAALKSELTAALADASPSVRIPAAEALARHGDADLDRAFAALRECADPTNTSAYAATAALNTIDELGAKATSLLSFIRTLPTSDPHATARGNEYVARLKAYILAKPVL